MTQGVHDRCFAGVILANQQIEAGREDKLDRVLVFPELPEILDLEAGHVHLAGDS